MTVVSPPALRLHGFLTRLCDVGPEDDFRALCADALSYHEDVTELDKRVQNVMAAEARWLEWSGGRYPDDSPGDVIAAEPDGTITLDDGVTTWNPLRAAEFFARRVQNVMVAALEQNDEWAAKLRECQASFAEIEAAAARFQARAAAYEQALRKIAEWAESASKEKRYVDGIAVIAREVLAAAEETK